MRQCSDPYSSDASVDLLAIHCDSRSRLLRTWRQPWLRVSVEERPRWHDDEHSEEGPTKPDPQRQVYALEDMPDDQGDDLSTVLGCPWTAALGWY